MVPVNVVGFDWYIRTRWNTGVKIARRPKKQI